MVTLIPFGIGLAVAFSLYFTIGWWGFLVIFPWIGFAITFAAYLKPKLPPHRKNIARRIAMVMILPALLLFVPIVNNENFQLEGVILLVLVGFFSKGIIHYEVAKVFGPLIWGRGFCGWACWTAAILEWLPVQKEGTIAPHLKHLRYLSLVISILIPLMLIFCLSYDVRKDYLYHREMVWMFIGNGIYYLLAIPLAFIFKDTRAFCKILCPVSLVMKLPSRFSLIKVRPSGKNCIGCTQCTKTCPMDIDVMAYIRNGRRVTDTECIHCGECKTACPAGAIR